ncbi:hypothetical protein V2G26_015138 [Clonostachys chloroleuca]
MQLNGRSQYGIAPSSFYHEHIVYLLSAEVQASFQRWWRSFANESLFITDESTGMQANSSHLQATLMSSMTRGALSCINSIPVVKARNRSPL